MVGPWQQIDVEKDMIYGMVDNHQNKLCRYSTEGDADHKSLYGAKKAWLCGVPKIGARTGTGTSNGAYDKNFKSKHGWCGVHVAQHQIDYNKKTDRFFGLDITVKDASKPKSLVMGQSKNDQSGPIQLAVDSNDNKVEVPTATGKLLVVKTAKPGSVDDLDAAPLEFWYDGDHWDSNSDAKKGGRCSIGKYDGGNRDIDCGFSC